jgi:hypothetical protein
MYFLDRIKKDIFSFGPVILQQHNKMSKQLVVTTLREYACLEKLKPYYIYYIVESEILKNTQ